MFSGARRRSGRRRRAVTRSGDDRRWRRSTAELSGGRADENDDGVLIWKHGYAPAVRANLGRQAEQLSAGWNGKTEPELVGEEDVAGGADSE